MHEFKVGVCRYQRFGLILLGATCVLLIGYGIAVVGFMDQYDRLGQHLFGTNYAYMIRPLGLVPAVIVMLGGSAIILRLMSKDPYVNCSHCRRFLAGGNVRPVTVATKHCPFCGQRVIDMPNGEPLGSPDRGETRM